MLAGELIQASMRQLGLIQSGEIPTVDEYADALSALNLMVNTWAARKLLSTSLTAENFPISAGVASYTIGVGGTFNTSKPTQIRGAFIRDANNIDSPLQANATMDMYLSMPDKSQASGIPFMLFYDPGVTQQSVQTGTIYLYPAPDVSSYKLYLECVKPFTQFTAITDVVTFPLSYLEALKYNLAVRLAPEFGRGVPPEIAIMAKETMDTIMRMNSRLELSKIEFASSGRFNMSNGDF